MPTWDEIESGALAQQRVNEALEIAWTHNHPADPADSLWIIDQMVRALTGRDYETWVDHWNHCHDLEPDYPFRAWQEGTLS